MDAFADVPAEYAGKFDVVHLRFWVAIIRENNVEPLIRHAMQLLSMFRSVLCVFTLLIRFLEPGGYLQWEDADCSQQIISGEAPERLLAVQTKLTSFLGLKYESVMCNPI